MSAESTEEAEALFQVSLPSRPYPGLRPYEKDEWPVFFGRERMVDAIVDRLAPESLLFVHGDSGCGKSSLIRAGVLPQLEQESARGGLRWRTCLAVPGESPLWHIAEALAGLAGKADEADVLHWRRLLNFGRGSAVAVAEALHERYPGEWICLLIDQFEELFDHARRHGPDEARLLTEFLVGLHEDKPDAFRTVVTMRSEFLGVCARYGSFAEVVNASQYLLPAMAPADLMRAIREPATLFDGEVSRELAERLIAEVGGSQDQLALIQHGMMMLHDANEDAQEGRPWRLDSADYRHPGGLAGMLSDHADQVMLTAQQAIGPTSVPPDRLVEDLFRALTDVNDGQAIRRRRSLAKVAAAAGVEPRTLAGVIDPFRAEGVSFIRPYGTEPLADDDVLDISHEALIRCWKRIAEKRDGWLVQEFRDGLVWRALLVQAESFERDPENILSPATAEERRAWLERHNAAWAERYGGGWDLVQRLVDASVKAMEAEKEQERQALVEATRRRSRTRLTWLAIGFALVCGALATFASYQAMEANDAATMARAAGIAATTARDNAERQRLIAEQERRDAEEARLRAEQALNQEKQALAEAKAATQRADRIQDVAVQAVQRQTKEAGSVDALMEQLSRTTDPFAVAVLAQGLVQASRSFSAAQLNDVTAALLRALSTTTDSSARATLAQAITALAPVLTPDQTIEMLKAILGAARTESDQPTRMALLGAGTTLAKGLPGTARAEALREIDKISSADVGSRLIAAIPALDAPDANARKLEVQRFVAALRDGKISPEEQVQVATALAEVFARNQLKTPAGQYNLLFILSRVPPEAWRRPGWAEVAGKLRADLGTFQRRIVRKEVQAGADTQARLKDVLDQLPPGLLEVMAQGRWAFRSIDNCSKPTETYTLTLQDLTALWRDGSGTTYPEEIQSDGTTEAVTRTAKAGPNPVGTLWKYTLAQDGRVLVKSAAREFEVLRCPR